MGREEREEEIKEGKSWGGGGGRRKRKPSPGF